MTPPDPSTAGSTAAAAVDSGLLRFVARGPSVRLGASGTARHPDVLNELADVHRGCRSKPADGERDAEVKQHADHADAFRRDAEQPVGRNVLSQRGDENPLEVEDIAE